MPSRKIAFASVEAKKQWIIDINRKHSDDFQNNELSRIAFKKQHPTEHISFLCMDGRIDLSEIIKAIPGIFRTYRHGGAAYDIGWPLFGDDLIDNVRRNAAEGKITAIWIGLHLASSGIEHRGCKAFGYNLTNDLAFKKNLRDRINYVFGDSAMVYPFIVAIDTDTKCLVFYSHDTESMFSTNELTDGSIESISARLMQLYPDMPASMVADIAFFVQNNLKVRDEWKSSPVEDDLTHNEFIVGSGKGISFDWLHELNSALIIGPYKPSDSAIFKVAFNLIIDNMKTDKIANTDFILLLSAIYDSKIKERQAREQVKYLRDAALEILNDKDNPPELKELAGKCFPMMVIVDKHTQLLTVVD